MSMSFVEAVFLGVVQGMTEWLPISSSGHLAIVQHYLNIQAPLLFDVMLHLGTIIALVAFFRRQILRALQTIGRMDIYGGGRTILYVIIATVPVALAGMFFRETVVDLFQDMHNISMLFIIMGFILINTRNQDGNKKLNLYDAVAIGSAQAFAIVPGISRSGVTISTALIRGVRRRQAFIFSFLLAVPAILGASAYEIHRAGAIDYDITPEMWVGTAVSAVVGYASLMILKDSIERSNFYKFGYYCWALGFLLLLIPIFQASFL